MIKLKKFESVGIVGFGGYLPNKRIKTKNIASAWHLAGKTQNLGVSQKAVANQDEDSLTMAVEASQICLLRAEIPAKKIGAVFVGSESHPYAVKPTGTILADILDIGREYFCADLEFSCKAGTTGLQITASMIESGMIDYGLVVASDKAQSQPGGALEYTAASGAAAFILGRKKREFSAQLISSYSFLSDTPDFWRRQKSDFPSHAARFTGKPAYFYHLGNCLKNFLKRINKKPDFFDYLVFHMPNAKFPLAVAKKFGFKFKQLELGFLVPQIGNPYSASSLLGLTSVLEQAEANKNILLVSYGSGAGSDAFWFKTRKKIKEKQKKGKLIKNYLKNCQEINYLDYLRNYGILK